MRVKIIQTFVHFKYMLLETDKLKHVTKALHSAAYEAFGTEDNTSHTHNKNVPQNIELDYKIAYKNG